MKHCTLLISFITAILPLFSQKLLPFQNPQSKKWGYKTENGRIEINAIYEDAKPVYKNYACVKTIEGWGIISTQKQGYIIEPQYLNVKISKDHVWVQDDFQLWGIRNYNGTQIQPCIYQSLTFWESVLYPDKKIEANWDTLLYKQNNTLGLMTRTGTLLKTLPYQYVYPFAQGSKYTVVGLGEYELGLFAGFYYRQFGVIDYQGNEIVPCVYDDIGYTASEMCSGKKYKAIAKNENKIRAVLGENCTYFNFKGEMIEPFNPCK